MGLVFVLKRIVGSFTRGCFFRRRHHLLIILTPVLVKIGAHPRLRITSRIPHIAVLIGSRHGRRRRRALRARWFCTRLGRGQGGHTRLWSRHRVFRGPRNAWGVRHGQVGFLAGLRVRARCLWRAEYRDPATAATAATDRPGHHRCASRFELEETAWDETPQLAKENTSFFSTNLKLRPSSRHFGGRHEVGGRWPEEKASPRCS